MRKLENHSLFPVWLQSVISGVLAFFIIFFLFNDLIFSPAGFILAALIINFFCASAICLLLYLPLRIIDANKLFEYDFWSLLKRYLPFYSLPFAFIFIFLLLLENSDFNELKVILCSLYLMAVTSLILFIKSVKNHINQLKQPENQPQTD